MDNFILLFAISLLGMQIEPQDENDEDVEYEVMMEPSFGEMEGDRLFDEGQRLYETFRYEETIEKFKQSLAVRRSDENCFFDPAAVFNSLGLAYDALGQYEKALACFDSALVFSRDQIFYGDRDKASAFNNIGRVYYVLGKYGVALAFFDSSLAINRELNDSGEVSLILNNAGGIYHALGKYDTALAFYDSSLGLRRKMKDRQGESVLLSNIGFTNAAFGKGTAAIRCYDSALAIAREFDDNFSEGVILNNIGEAFFLLGKYSQALVYFDSALAMRRAVFNRYGEGITLMNIGKSFEKMGELDQALRFYEEAVSVKESIGKEFRRAELLDYYTKAEKDIYELIIDLLVRLKRDKEAYEYLERSKSETLRQVFMESGIAAYDSSLKNELQRLDGLELDMSYLRNDFQKRLLTRTAFDSAHNELEGKYNQTLVDLKAYHPEVYDLLEPNRRRFEDIQQTIPDSALYIQFVAAEGRYLAFLLTAGSFGTQLLSDRLQIDTLIAAYRFAAATRDGEQMKKFLGDLYDLLIRPIESAIDDKRDIVVIPYGPLHYLPFHALVKLKDDGKYEYLVERKRLSYLPSASFIEEFVRKDDVHKAKVIAFGNADSTLPYAEQEVNDLAKIFPGAVVFTKDKATKSKLTELAGQFNIVHLATHGRLDIDPRRSHIVLAPKGEGELTCREIMGMPGLFKAKSILVTLSACETAIEKDPQKAGRELTSLSEAFKRVGVPTIVATLWPVCDISTSELMKDFYLNLRKTKNDVLEALRQAQIKMLSSGKYTDPFFWAPFILIGQWE